MDKKTQQDLLKLVEKNYQEIADDFIKTRQKKIWPELLKLADTVERGDSVLDAGCGNGRLLQAFRFKPIRYIGIDFNIKFIQYAKAEWAIPDGEFVYGNILELDNNPDINEFFDYVFCIAVLHNIPGKDLRTRALKQLAGKAKEDGKMIISVWNLWNKWKYLKLIAKYTVLWLAGFNKMDQGDILFDWKGAPASKRYYHAFTAKELVDLAASAGLKIEKIYKDKFNYYLVLAK